MDFLQPNLIIDCKLITSSGMTDSFLCQSGENYRQEGAEPPMEKATHQKTTTEKTRWSLFGTLLLLKAPKQKRQGERHNL